MLLRCYWDVRMSTCHTCSRDLTTLQSEHSMFTSLLRAPTLTSLERADVLDWIEKTKFQCGSTLSTCQEKEMGSYSNTSGIRQGWRGGEDSRVTAVINHLPRQPNAGRHEGACWPGWLFVYSLSGCRFARQSQVECCLSLNHLPIYQSITFPGSTLYVACFISEQFNKAVAQSQ